MAGTPHPILPGTPTSEPSWKATGCCPSSPDSRSARPCCGSEPTSSPWRAPATCAAAGDWAASPCSSPAAACGGRATSSSPARRPAAVSAASRWSRPAWRWRWPALAAATAVAATRKTLPAFAGLALLTLLVAYAHSLFATPGLFRASAALGSWGPAGAILVLATMLVGLGLEFKPSRKVRIARAHRRGRRRPAAHPGRGRAGRSRAGRAAGLDRGAAARRPGRHRRCIARGPRRLARAATPSRPAAPRPPRAVPLVDSLTQLPTRVYFEDRLAAAATKADASASRLALLFIDLDGFKPVNDTYGHSIGDLVLEQVGQRLKAMSRGKDVVARVGGDEFLLLLTNVADRGGGRPGRVAPDPGPLASVRGRGPRGHDLLLGRHRHVPRRLQPRQADRPRRRRDVRRPSAPAAPTTASIRRRWTPTPRPSSTLLRDLRKAVAAKEFELFYQPKIDSKSGKVTAVEALLRWKHPTRGMLLPSVFIPIAERFGLIGAIGNWVIEDACRQSRAWRDKGLRMRVAINLSAHQMRQDDIVERITGALAAAPDPPVAADLRDHRVGGDGGHQDDAGDLPPPRRARHAPVDRRLRHRLLEPGLPAQAAGRGAEDRPQLHHGPRAQRRRARGGRRRHQAGARARPEGRRRGRREPAPAADPGARCSATSCRASCSPSRCRPGRCCSGRSTTARKPPVFKPSLFDETRQSEPV